MPRWTPSGMEEVPMKLLLINREGHPVACLEDLEKYDGRSPGHVFALLDLLEKLIATAKGMQKQENNERTERSHV